MSVKVINIVKEYEPILGFLYPTYTITDSVCVSSKFITHRQIVSKAQRDVLEFQYSDCVIISTQIFDELWDEAKIVEECIKFARTRLRSRKTKFEPAKETFIDDCISFLFGLTLDEEDDAILQLFEQLGSASFPVKYFDIIEKVPYQQVFAALNTFISKIDKNSTNVFFKKKAFLYKDKIDGNLLKAIDNYTLAIKGNGVAECKFIMDLFV